MSALYHIQKLKNYKNCKSPDIPTNFKRYQILIEQIQKIIESYDGVRSFDRKLRYQPNKATIF